MTDSGFDSGPPPKKSKASSPTSSITSLNLPQQVPQSTALPVRLPSDIGTNVQHNNTEKQRLIQQHLVLILHARKCLRREQVNGAHNPPCPLRQCQSMKNVLRHMAECTEGRLCLYKVHDCSSSRQIIGHWRNCFRPDCPICAPFKKGTLRRPLGLPSTVGPASGAVALLAYDGFSPKHATAVNPPPAKCSDSTMTQMNLASSAFGIGASYTGFKSLQSSLGEEDIPPIPGQDWRVSVTQDLRNHLVHQLVQAIFPTHGPMALKDPRMSNLVRLAENVEGDMYEDARSREDYKHFLTEKMDKIQKHLEQKKLRRIIDQKGNNCL